MKINISRAALSVILGAARADPQREICGLLLGEGRHVTQARQAANVSGDPARRFEIDPAVLIAAHRDARRGGLAILGHYHSHPNGRTEPSAHDASMAIADGSLWLICSPDGGHGIWAATGTGLHGCFEACEAEWSE